MKKKLMSFLLTAALAAGLMACAPAAAPAPAASSDDEAEAVEATTADSGEIAHLIFLYPAPTKMPDGENTLKVQEAMNKILREKIGAEIEIQFFAPGSYQEQSNLMLSGDEQVDCLFMFKAQVAPAIASEQLRDIGPYLEEYGQELIEAVGADFVDCGKFSGVQYTIPTKTEIAQGLGMFLLNAEICEKYNIDTDAIKSFEDLTEVFKTVHENEPEMQVLYPVSAGSTLVDSQLEVDKLSDYFGVLDNYGEKLEVVNLFETETYKRACDQMHEWYEMGFISDDVVSGTEGGRDKMKAGSLFAYNQVWKPGIETQEETTTGRDLIGIKLLPALKCTNNWGTYGIPENAKYPEKAMQFLNLLYTDSELLNLFAYGIEGEDYVIHEDGRIGYPEGLDANTVGYNISSRLWAMGNQFIAYVWETNPADIWELTNEFAENKDGYTSAAYGFNFDSAPVAVEEASVQNAYSQYQMALENGLLDPETAIPEMNKKLYEAGLQKIMDEKQAQLDAWAAQNAE